ncbi:TPA: PAAR domain-containing protein [Stenotrophomonas maltophilia]|nr:PAAR domain-containing protein [Stenotrophomonas maltophilia]
MRTIIVLGDRHSGRGSVITGSTETDIDGKPVARVGDKAICPLHKGVFSVVTGDDSLMIDGQAVARDGDKLSCSCSLISGQQNHAWVAAAGGAVPAPVPQSSIQKQNSPLLPKSEVCEECLLAAAKSGTAFLGR